MVPGAFLAFFPARADAHDDLVITAESPAESMHPHWALYTVAAALSSGAPLARHPLRPRIIGKEDGRFRDFGSSASGDWFQAGRDFYYVPLLDRCVAVPEPAALPAVTYRPWAVLGAPDKERCVLIAVHGNLAAYDMHTGAKLFEIAQQPRIWVLWPEQGLAGMRSVTLFSLPDGARVPHTNAANTIPRY